ncbi:MAG: DUF1156 domain-containing protein [Pirellulales bacterium]
MTKPKPTTTYRKKLIEVALPLAAINAESAREKSIRHGHPSTLHLWWARRPLAACRAVLFASLVNDPGDDPMYGVSEEIAGSERAKLFNLIEDLVKWENSNNPEVISKARAEIARSIAANKVADGDWRNEQVVVTVDNKAATAHDIKHKLASRPLVNAFLAEHAPPVHDPFAGGGSIPLEAHRLGLRANASDLNPIPVLINKALIEIPSKFAGHPPVNPSWQKKNKEQKAATTWCGARGLAEDVRYYGQWMRDEAEKRIGNLYPKVEVAAEMAQGRPDLLPYVGQELTIIAWLWARTIQCPNPGCRARMPLIRSFWLSKKKGKECYAKPVLDEALKTVQFEISNKGQPPKHTTDRTGARCLFCETFVKKQQLRNLAIEHGVVPIPLAIVAEGTRGRVYLSDNDVPTASVPRPDVAFLEQPITNDRRWFSPPLYGLPNFADLFTTRQLTALTTFSDLIGAARDKLRRDAAESGWIDDERPLSDGGRGPIAYSDAVATYLAFAQSKACNRNTTLCLWENTMDRIVATFGRQALPMVWDFAETNPFAGAGGDLYGTVESVCEVLDNLNDGLVGCVNQVDATEFESNAMPMISTDPPYYDNIGYADLSDFFYLWLRRALGRIYPSLFSTVLTPKKQELIAVSHRHGGSREAAKQFFEQGLSRAFARMREVGNLAYPLTIFYAFKQSETDEEDELEANTMSTGWETMLAGVINAGFVIDGTWPIRTEQPKGLRAFNVNALASSIVLVCRSRPGNASLATRKEFITALRRELPEALRNLQRGNIAPVDLAQAAIGPGMSVFTRYAKVLESDGSPMTVRTALGLINQSLDEVLAEQEGEFDGDTRWALAWFEQFGMDEGPFGDAETLSKAKNTAINGLVEAGIVTARAGKVRLVRRDELPEDWSPATDGRLTIWEVTQHLIRRLDQHGESGAAALVGQLGSVSEIARDLAYRLYSTCERKKWASEALAYNSLVVAWPELTKLATAARPQRRSTQSELFT